MKFTPWEIATAVVIAIPAGFAVITTAVFLSRPPAPVAQPNIVHFPAPSKSVPAPAPQPVKPVPVAATPNAAFIKAELGKNSWVKDVFVNEIGSVYIAVNRYEKRWDAPMIHRYICATVKNSGSTERITVVRFIDGAKLVETNSLWDAEIIKFDCAK
jgi:hypothetical protein